MNPPYPAPPPLRTRILEATLRQVMVEGFTTSTSAIAQEAQVGTGSLFRYFPTKTQLLQAAFAYASDLLRPPAAAADLSPPALTVYARCQQLWRQTAQQAARHRAAFHYWRQYRTLPQHTGWCPPTELLLGPFDQVPGLLQRASGRTHYCEVDAWLLTSQWTALVQFILDTFYVGPGATYDPEQGPTPAQLLDRAYEAWWEGLGLLREMQVRTY